jgi:hypothetical protein
LRLSNEHSNPTSFILGKPKAKGSLKIVAAVHAQEIQIQISNHCFMTWVTRAAAFKVE